jgi:hypothetical protein
MHRARRIGGRGFTANLVVLAGLVVSGVACRTEEPSAACTPGESAACSCEDGTRGAQSCREDGAGFDECVCRDGEEGGEAEAGAPGASTSSAGRSSKMGNAGRGGSESDAGAGGTSAGGTSAGDQEPTTSSGGTSTSTSSNGGPHEYGEGDYGITLSEPESDIYCWIIQENTTVCNGTLTTDYEDLCIAREKDCSSRVPNNTSEDKGDCYFSSTYELVSRGPLTGTCEKLEAYWDDDPSVECLFHRHCGPGGSCIDYRCFCPEGAHCDPEPPPPPPGGDAARGGAGPGDGGGGAGTSGSGGTGALPSGGTSSGGTGPTPPNPPPPAPPSPSAPPSPPAPSPP